VVLGIAVHREAVAIDRVEARVRVPGLVEVDAVDARVEQLLDAPRVVAEAVVGGVRDNEWTARVSIPFRHERVRLDCGLDRRFVSRGGIGPMIP
jgi:hypothetical protein